MPEGLWEQALDALSDVETAMGARLGDAHNPLLVSVRTGARVSMPGMMDTVLTCVQIQDLNAWCELARNGCTEGASDL